MEQVRPETQGSNGHGAGARCVPERGTLGLSDAAWAEARRRAAVIAPLAAHDSVPASMARDTGRALGLSERTIYGLLRLWRRSGGLVASLAPRPSPGGRSKGRLTAAVEQVVAEAIRDEYLTKQKKRAEAVVRAVRERCRVAGISPPRPIRCAPGSAACAPTRLRVPGRRWQWCCAPADDSSGADARSRAAHGGSADRPYPGRSDPGGRDMAQAGWATVAVGGDRRLQPLRGGPVPVLRGAVRDHCRPVPVPCGARQRSHPARARHRRRLAVPRLARRGVRGQRVRIPLRCLRTWMPATRHRAALSTSGRASLGPARPTTASHESWSVSGEPMPPRPERMRSTFRSWSCRCRPSPRCHASTLPC